MKLDKMANRITFLMKFRLNLLALRRIIIRERYNSVERRTRRNLCNNLKNKRDLERVSFGMIIMTTFFRGVMTLESRLLRSLYRTMNEGNLRGGRLQTLDIGTSLVPRPQILTVQFTKLNSLILS